MEGHDFRILKSKGLSNITWFYPPARIPVANEGLVRDSLLKMFHNPGGDWNPGWGVDLKYNPIQLHKFI